MRSGLPVAPEAGDMNRGLPDRFIGIARNLRTIDRAPGSSIAASVQTVLRCVGARHARRLPRVATARLAYFRSSRDRNSIVFRCTAGRRSPSNLIFLAAASQSGEPSTARSNCVPRASSITGAPRAELDRSRPAHPAFEAATSGSKACTSRPYRRSAGCHRHPRAHRSGESRGRNSRQSLRRWW